MSGDRRKSDSRRASDRRSADRRAQNADRRGVEGRRTVDTAKSPAKQEQAAPVPGRAAETVKKILKRLAILLVVLVTVFTGLIVYFFSNFEYYMNKIAQNIEIENTKATIDGESLTDRITRASLMLKVTNRLPFAVVLQNLKMNAKISGYTVAKGVQVMQRVAVEAGQEKVLQVQFHVDSIMTRRGLQKAIKKNAGSLLKSLLSNIQGKRDAFKENIIGLMATEGSAEFRLMIGGIEIPFERKFNFSQGS
jgi:LEA14-like dessication related protein